MKAMKIGGGRERVCHVISHQGWIADTMSSALDGSRDWRIVRHDGLSPVEGIGPDEAVWTSPGQLIAQNAWLESLGRPPIRLAAPSPSWPLCLDRNLLGRRVILAEAGRIRSWKALPPGLGTLPWSQVSQGRVTGFRAARRSLETLKADLRAAPDDALIQVEGHLTAIREEWRVTVVGGRAVNSSGYCLHAGEIDRTIVTVFDGARFDPALRPLAQAAAVEAAARADLDSVCIDLAFCGGPGMAGHEKAGPFVLEVDPVWCSAPYDFGRAGMEAFLQAVLACRKPDLLARGTYHPESWMLESFGRRYRSWWGPRPVRP